MLSLSPQRSAIVLVDLQVDVLRTLDDSGEVNQRAALVERTCALVEEARHRDIPVIWVKVERRPDLRDQADVSNELVRSGRATSPRETRRLIAGTPGADFLPNLRPSSDEDVVVKRRVGGFHGTSLDVLLRARDLTTILLGGVNTEMGVESTARAAWDHDYQTMVARDCCASSNPAAHRNALEMTLPRFAEITTANAVMESLRSTDTASVSGTPDTRAGD